MILNKIIVRNREDGSESKGVRYGERGEKRGGRVGRGSRNKVNGLTEM